MSPSLSELLKKYLKGECSHEEEVLLLNWYNSFQRESDIFNFMSDAEAQEIKERMFARIKANIDNTVTHDGEGKSHKPLKRNPLMYWLSGAAAILLVAFALFQYSGQTLIKPSELITVNNLSRSIHKIVLADSSIVWLSPQSKLQYPDRFKGGSRAVSMNGEAFFEVTRDPKNPFVIHSGNVVTKVLGTSFRIKSFEGSNSTEVSVMTGKVSVSIPGKHDDEVTILPSHKITYLLDKKLLKKDLEEKSSSMRIWEKTTVSFENTPVSDVIMQLNKKFGVQMSAGDPEIAKYVLNADFTDQSLPAILQMLEKSLHISYTINDENITLTKKI